MERKKRPRSERKLLKVEDYGKFKIKYYEQENLNENLDEFYDKVAELLYNQAVRDMA